MQPKISILLLNYNGKQFNQACIESILVQTYQYFEILFIDNASTDDSVEKVEQLFTKEIKNWRIKIIKNETNEGFANGNNIWHKSANSQSKYICLLNNDTVVEKNWLEELVKVIEKDENLGAAWSLILEKGYEQQLQLMTKQKKIANLTMLGEYSIRQEKFVYPHCEVTALSGCCILYRKAIVSTPFPKRYFAYAEDVFFNLLLLIEGHKMAFCPLSIVHHYGSGSFSKKPSYFKLFYGNRNQIVNFLVFYKISTIIKLLPLFLIAQLGHLFVNAPLNRLKAKLKARWRIIKHRKKVKNLRNKVQKKRKLTDAEFLKLLSKDMSSPELFYGKFSPIQSKIISNLNKLFYQYYKILR